MRWTLGKIAAILLAVGVALAGIAAIVATTQTPQTSVWMNPTMYAAYACVAVAVVLTLAAARSRETPTGGSAAFDSDDEALIEVDGGRVEGFKRVSKARGRSKQFFRKTRIRRNA